MLRLFLCSLSAVCMSNLFVEPEHGADHGDISKGDSLSHEEGTGVQVLVQDCQGLLHIFLGLLCGLGRSTQNNYLLHSLVPSHNRVLHCGQLPTFHHSYQIITTLTTKCWPAYLFVELHDPQSGEDPCAGWRDDLGVSKAHPLQHLGCCLRGCATQGIIAHCCWETENTLKKINDTSQTVGFLRSNNIKGELSELIKPSMK